MSESATVRQIVKTTCCYCGVGCGVNAVVEDARLIAVSGDKAHPANRGRLCVKGSSLHETQENQDRLLSPRVLGEETDWDHALTHVAAGFSSIIQRHGPDAVAFYLSGQLLTEDYYVANKLIKGFIGTANVDTNSRLCMASAVVAHKRAFGGDLVPGCYEDLELADLVILTGSNTAYAHPIIYQRIASAKARRPEMKVVVIDPRRTATCDLADIHLPLKPGSDAFLFNGLLAYLAAEGGLDRDYIQKHCDGFEHALAAAVEQAGSVEQAAKMCDLPAAQLREVYRLFAATPCAVTLFSQGINQSSSGVDKGNAIINCHLASGKIGRPGATPFSITGQPNAMGGREVGGLANQLAAHMGFADPADVDRVARFWDAPNMAQKDGLKAVDLFQAIEDGRIKAVWVMATNPVVSMPNADKVKRALAKCELVVVSECVENTDTARMAHVLLPASTWSEKNGTVTNSERCISLQKGFLSPPGDALHDWQILCRFAQKLGFKQGFNYSHPAEIFREHAALSAFENDNSRGFDIGAMKDISLEQYQALEPVRWPVTAQAPQGTDRLFVDGQYFTPGRRAQLIPIWARLPDAAVAGDQILMNTGRIRDQWHTMSRTGTAPRLLSHTDEPHIDAHPEDIERLGLTVGALAQLESRQGRYFGRVKSSRAQRPGEIFVPMHWNGKYASCSRADALVGDVVDPLSGQPEFKHVPVTLSPFPQVWAGVLMCTEDITPELSYWSKISLEAGFKFRLAASSPNDWKGWLRLQFAHIETWTELLDSQQNFYRALGMCGGRVRVIFSAKVGTQPVAESSWLEQRLGEPADLDRRRAILAGGQGTELEPTGAIICSCFQVGDFAIRKAISEGCPDLGMLSERLKCGTNCGSCIPELKALLAAG